MILCSLIEELYTKEENGKTDCNFNFGHECIRHRNYYLNVRKLESDKNLCQRHSSSSAWWLTDDKSVKYSEVDLFP